MAGGVQHPSLLEDGEIPRGIAGGGRHHQHRRARSKAKESTRQSEEDVRLQDEAVRNRTRSPRRHRARERPLPTTPCIHQRTRTRCLPRPGACPTTRGAPSPHSRPGRSLLLRIRQDKSPRGRTGPPRPSWFLRLPLLRPQHHTTTRRRLLLRLGAPGRPCPSSSVPRSSTRSWKRRNSRATSRNPNINRAPGYGRLRIPNNRRRTYRHNLWPNSRASCAVYRIPMGVRTDMFSAAKRSQVDHPCSTRIAGGTGAGTRGMETEHQRFLKRMSTTRTTAGATLRMKKVGGMVTGTPTTSVYVSLPMFPMLERRLSPQERLHTCPHPRLGHLRLENGR